MMKKYTGSSSQYEHYASHPPYSKIPIEKVFSSGEAASDASNRIKQSSSSAAVEASVNSGSYNHEPHSRKENDEGSRKLGMRASVIQVESSDSGNSDSDEVTSQNKFKGTFKHKFISKDKGLSFEFTEKFQ
ncbi:hypothetical protein V6N12_072004 [Hibiscus sabdariffa]|uniref:Uncharacterized protein n=1 Tax=Hibiscus sabdariffa TaxID=183260 RepID=A0ABR2FM13_9ROSI